MQRLPLLPHIIAKGAEDVKRKEGDATRQIPQGAHKVIDNSTCGNNRARHNPKVGQCSQQGRIYQAVNPGRHRKRKIKNPLPGCNRLMERGHKSKYHQQPGHPHYITGCPPKSIGGAKMKIKTRGDEHAEKIENLLREFCAQA